MEISVSMATIGLVLVYWGLTPQQQPGSYQGGEMIMKSVFQVEKTGVPGGNHRPTASNWWNFSHIRPLPSPGIELGPQRCEAKWAKAQWERRLSSPSYRGPLHGDGDKALAGKPSVDCTWSYLDEVRQTGCLRQQAFYSGQRTDDGTICISEITQ